MIVFSALAVLCVAVLFRFKNIIKSRKIFYVVGIIAVIAVSFFTVYTDKTNYFGLPMGVYDAQYIVSGSLPDVPFSVYDLLFALQSGFLVFCFGLWKQLCCL